MIAILDPALLKPRKDSLVEYELNLVLQCCQQHSNLRILPFEEYWRSMWMTFGRALEQQLIDRRAKNALRELRKCGNQYATTGIAPAPPAVAWLRGFQQLFAAQWLNGEWEQTMARVVVRAVATGEEVVVLTRRIPGRNLNLLRAGQSVLHENTRWLLHVQPSGTGPCHIPCVYHPRNLSLRWTTRFDTRLPATEDGAQYAFCPPDEWWKPRTPAVQTVQSKPCFIDAHQRGWARPNIQGGAGHHWDVFVVDQNEQQALGLSQLNIVELGAPPEEGVAGRVHHLPKKKQHAFKDRGWSCP